MDSEKFEKLQTLLSSDRAADAREIFNALSEENSAEYFLLKGKIAQKFQQWSEAMNAYHRVLEIESGNMEATNNIHLIQNILNFWNPEMFNP